jgi:hypothetical protein
VEDEAAAQHDLPPKPSTPVLKGLKRSTLRRNLSVPSLEALGHVEHSLLSDESALNAALAAAGHTGMHPINAATAN